MGVPRHLARRRPAAIVGTRTIDAVSTPGHTQGHFVFADLEAGLLFAGDHVLPTITPSIGFEPAYADQPLGDFLGSLAKVRAMPDLRLLPAHGDVTPSTHTRIDALVAHHDERLALCLASVLAGRTTAYAVAGDLPWTRHERRLDELDVFNSALASMETMAHLELLAARGLDHERRRRWDQRLRAVLTPVLAASPTFWPKTGTQRSESEYVDFARAPSRTGTSC